MSGEIEWSDPWDRVSELENELILVHAQADGAVSLLLSVQKDCIEVQKELRGVQIAYTELEKEYQEFKDEMSDLALERDLYC